MKNHMAESFFLSFVASLMLVANAAAACTNDANSRCIDFGSDNELVSGVVYNAEALSAAEVDSGVTCRKIKPMALLDVKIPAFNVDSQGLPQTPLLLEVKFKDNYISGLVPFYSRINYVSDDPGVSRDKMFMAISPIMTGPSQEWKMYQYIFQKTPFQLIRAVDGYFNIQIAMPNKADYTFPVDYISVRTATDSEAVADHELAPVKAGFNKSNPWDGYPTVPSYQDANLEVFVRDAMRPIYKYSVPQPSEINKGLAATATYDDTVALSFGLYSAQGIDSLSFSVSGLTCGAATIPKENISLFRVVPDLRRLGSVLAPHHSLYALIPDRLEELSAPIVVFPTLSENIWIKIKTGSGYPAGDYLGTINIQRNGVTIKNVLIRLKMLPFALDPPRHINPVYQDPYATTYSSRIADVYNFYKEIGFDPFYYLNESRVIPLRDAQNNIVDFDLSYFEQQLRTMKQNGFLKNRMILETRGGFLYSEIKTPHNNTYEKLSDPVFVSAYGRLIKKLIEVGSRNGVNIIFSLIDEPWYGSDKERMAVADRLGQIVRNNGGQTTVTYHTFCEKPFTYTTPDNRQYTINLKDIIDYKVWLCTTQGAGFALQYQHYGYYTTFDSHLRNPIYNRFLHGLLAFGTDAEIVSAYAMGAIINDPFNDFDYTDPYGKWPDFIYAYPVWSGKLITAMNAEGVREGIKDARYLATLQRLINEHPGVAADEAGAYLASIKKRINPNYWNTYHPASGEDGYDHKIILGSISDSADPSDYESFTNIRETVIFYIQQLRSSVPPTRMSVTWTDLVGVLVSGNTITKTASTVWGNGGAASLQRIPADGSVEFQSNDVANNFAMCGLSSTNANASFETIGYALYLYMGRICVYESGVQRLGPYQGSFGDYVLSDKFKVERSGSTIRYKKNGVVFYASPAPSVGPLLVDAAIYNQGGAVAKAELAFPSGIMLGDVSGNGQISSTDASLALRIAVDQSLVLGPAESSLSAQDQHKAADVTGGSGVSAYDASLIVQYAVGLITKFPAGG